MATHLRIFTPIANQKITKPKVNVIGRVMSPKIKHMSILLNNFLVRRMRPSRNGAFECRIDISHLENGEHTVEVRSQVGQGTDRVMVTFRKMVEEEVSEED